MLVRSGVWEIGGGGANAARAVDFTRTERNLDPRAGYTYSRDRYFSSRYWFFGPQVVLSTFRKLA